MQSDVLYVRPTSGLPDVDECEFEYKLMMSKNGRVRAKKSHASMATCMITNEGTMNGKETQTFDPDNQLTPSRKRFSDLNGNVEMQGVNEQRTTVHFTEEGRKIPKYHSRTNSNASQSDKTEFEHKTSSESNGASNFLRHNPVTNSKRSIVRKSLRGSMKVNDLEERTNEITLEEMLKSKAAVHAFREFLRSEFSEENLDFWLDCESYKTLKGAKQMRMAFRIFTEYLAKSAEREVNIDSEIRSRTEERLKNPNKDTFVEAQNCIYRLMKCDSFRRFVTSDKYSKIPESNEGFRISLKRVSTKKKMSR